MPRFRVKVHAEPQDGSQPALSVANDEPFRLHGPSGRGTRFLSADRQNSEGQDRGVDDGSIGVVHWGYSIMLFRVLPGWGGVILAPRPGPPDRKGPSPRATGLLDSHGVGIDALDRTDPRGSFARTCRPIRGRICPEASPTERRDERSSSRRARRSRLTARLADQYPNVATRPFVKANPPPGPGMAAWNASAAPPTVGKSGSGMGRTPKPEPEVGKVASPTAVRTSRKAEHAGVIGVGTGGGALARRKAVPGPGALERVRSQVWPRIGAVAARVGAAGSGGEIPSWQPAPVAETEAGKGVWRKTPRPCVTA